MAAMPPEAILGTLHLGLMSMVATLTDAEKTAVASWLVGSPVNPFRLPEPPKPQGMCGAPPEHPPDLLTGQTWNGWSGGLTNSRFQSAEMAGLTEQQIPRLKLKWAFGFPGAIAAWSQPVVAGGRVFVGSMNGAVYALNAATGCTHWIYQASPAGVRSAVNIGPGASPGTFVAYFGDLTGSVHAIDAMTGQPLWKTKVDQHPLARITGGVQLYGGRLYVPVASLEEGSAMNPKYECCTFRGSVVALDVKTGKEIWKTWMIPKPPHLTGKSEAGTQLWGPSGAAIWSAPTLDIKRKLLYVTTGDHYSDPEEGAGDSVVALDMASGKVAWQRKFLEGDRWNGGCISSDNAGCPEREGPDLDFGSSPILHTLGNGKQVLLAGQKSGMMYILDADNAPTVIRQMRLAKGGILGGIEWGPAADRDRVYVAISDMSWTDQTAGGGLTAVQIGTGETVWHVSASKPACLGERGCSAAQPAAVTAIPGAVFSGSLDGHLRVWSAGEGKLLWDLDTRRAFTTVNQVPGRGGSLNGAGPSVVGGTVFVNSGYGFFGGSAGNVLLALTVDGK
jgi:polyvinyl alcohol dehydrogenase (cytochrome)